MKLVRTSRTHTLSLAYDPTLTEKLGLINQIGNGHTSLERGRKNRHSSKMSGPQLRGQRITPWESTRQLLVRHLGETDPLFLEEKCEPNNEESFRAAEARLRARASRIGVALNH
jgi:hypothetical protein